MIQEHMISTGKAAKLLGVSVRTIYRWEKAGHLIPVSRLKLPPSVRRTIIRRMSTKVLSAHAWWLMVNPGEED